MDQDPQMYCKYRNGLKDIYLEKMKKLPKDKPLVLWFYGPTGTGKTRRAVEIGEEFGGYWMSGQNLQWFDGYQTLETPVAIIDDFRKDFCTFHYLLRLFDRYPLNVPVKGGFVAWRP